MGQVLLVRHGQASWGAEDYDVLSERGVQQSDALGRALAARDVVPTLVVSGTMRRHRETAAAAAGAAGWDVPVTDDAGWDEFDHLHVLSLHPAPEGVDVMSSPAAFQAWFEQATGRWTGGDHDADYPESFDAFATRVGEAVDRAVAAAADGGTVVVFTSGGPMAWAAAALLAGEPTHRRDLWPRLNRVTVNTGVTKVIASSRGTSLVTLNEHAHLSPDLVTYR